MHPRAHPSQTRLWLVSLAASVGVNALVIAALAVWTADARIDVQDSLARTVTREEPSLVFLAPVMEALKPKPVPPPDPPALLRKNTVDSSATQQSDAPEKKTAESQRNTRATSNAPPVEGAPAVPSLRGSEIDDGRKLATYRSDYKEGDISHPGRGDLERTEAATPAPSPVEPAPRANSSSTPAGEGQPKTQAALPGTAPVNRSVLKQPEAPEGVVTPEAQSVSEAPKRQQDDGLSIESKPMQLEGSVAAVGVGSQDAIDTPEARYIDVVRRSVERYWQADMVRSRDFNLVGTAVFHVTIDPAGKVLRAKFEEKDGLGDVQKGFMYSSIKDHLHPAMPAELKKKIKDKPFEFNLSFTIRP